MDTLKQLLQEHFNSHQDIEIRDAVKFLYQSHMGPGHLIPDESAALARLEAEWSIIHGSTDAIPYIPIGNGLYRLNLCYCKGIHLSPHTVNALFCQTANSWIPDPAAMKKSLALIYTLPFPKDKVDRYLEQYERDGCPMVSHSDSYRQTYSPAYRIVSEEFIRLLPILVSIDSLMAAGDGTRVAIDGPCASGKSTLGRLLSQIYRCPLLSMDDFFLRPEQRTPERLAEPGGNVDHERFYQEVLAPLIEHRSAHYRRWDCHFQSFAPAQQIESAPLIITEGSYALRPELRGHYHLRIWVEAPWEVRRQRLLDRDGPDLLDRFLSTWIPMEDRYFSACSVKACCHLVWDGSGKE